MRIFSFFIVVLALAGCASRQDLAQIDDETCRSYGAQPGSQTYIECRMQKDQLRQQGQTARAAAILSAPVEAPVFVNPGTGRRF